MMATTTSSGVGPAAVDLHVRDRREPGRPLGARALRGRRVGVVASSRLGARGGQRAAVVGGRHAGGQRAGGGAQPDHEGRLPAPSGSAGRRPRWRRPRSPPARWRRGRRAGGGPPSRGGRRPRHGRPARGRGCAGWPAGRRRCRAAGARGGPPGRSRPSSCPPPSARPAPRASPPTCPAGASPNHRTSRRPHRRGPPPAAAGARIASVLAAHDRRRGHPRPHPGRVAGRHPAAARPGAPLPGGGGHPRPRRGAHGGRGRVRGARRRPGRRGRRRRQRLAPTAPRAVAAAARRPGRPRAAAGQGPGAAGGRGRHRRRHRRVPRRRPASACAPTTSTTLVAAGRRRPRPTWPAGCSTGARWPTRSSSRACRCSPASGRCAASCSSRSPRARRQRLPGRGGAQQPRRPATRLRRARPGARRACGTAPRRRSWRNPVVGFARKLAMLLSACWSYVRFAVGRLRRAGGLSRPRRRRPSVARPRARSRGASKSTSTSSPRMAAKAWSPQWSAPASGLGQVVLGEPADVGALERVGLRARRRRPGSGTPASRAACG